MKIGLREIDHAGEVLAERDYDLKLLPGLQRRYDAKGRDGKNIQIKTTMKRVRANARTSTSQAAR